MSLKNADYYDHPVFNPMELQLDTFAIKQLDEDMHRMLWTGETGALVYGRAREGKTTAITSVSEKLYTRANDKVPTFFVSIPSRDHKTITSIFRVLCLSAHLRVTSHDRADHLSNRYIHFIADEATKANCSQAVLIVDEMQRLQLSQFDAFAELHDELLRLQIRLMVIFVGNDPECWSLVKRIESPHYAHIHGRFFHQALPFIGLTSKTDVKECLLQYDTLRYPKNGPTYTEYFLPNAVTNGWKIASLSSDIWRVFNEYQRNYKIKSWGMKYFTITINTLLTDFLSEQNLNDIDDDVIHECIRLSSLIPSLVAPDK